VRLLDGVVPDHVSGAKIADFDPLTPAPVLLQIPAGSTAALPLVLVSESARRSSGPAPYWRPGTQVMWREGSGPLGTGEPVLDTSLPHFAVPVSVVRDDAEALVVWLRTGTPVLRAARADGLDKRADRSTLFTAAVVQDLGVHAYYDQVRVAPTGRPWSVWALFAEGNREFAGWYVNLERPHVRDSLAVYTSDHALDLWVEPDRTMLGQFRSCQTALSR